MYNAHLEAIHEVIDAVERDQRGAVGAAGGGEEDGNGGFVVFGGGGRLTGAERGGLAKRVSFFLCVFFCGGIAFVIFSFFCVD